MRTVRDFTGQRFHKLTAIKFTGRFTSSRNAIWELSCDCGGIRLADSGSLAKGAAKSCGCFLKTQFNCSVDGCNGKASSKNLCNKHYKRHLATGDVSRSSSGTSNDVAERFLLKTVRAQNGCVEWTGHVGVDGYGQTSWNGKKYNTHRLAWVLAFGPVRKGLCVCHKCDNPRCVNVEHLFLGTQKENIKDAISKGRFDPTRMARLNQERARAMVK